jgi:hypothetical protein
MRTKGRKTPVRLLSRPFALVCVAVPFTAFALVFGASRAAPASSAAAPPITVVREVFDPWPGRRPPLPAPFVVDQVIDPWKKERSEGQSSN